MVPAVVACAVVAAFVLTHLPGLSGDTVALVHGSRTIAYCVSHGIFSKCDRLRQFIFGGPAVASHERIPEGAVAPYPIFQYVPALLFTQLGMSDRGVFKAFGVISLVSFCASVGLAAWLSSQVKGRWAPAVMVILLTTSPLVYYSWLTFGESLAALLMIVLATAGLLRWPPLAVALAAALACLTKETIFPMVAILGGVSLWATPIATRPLRRGHWIGLTLGVLVGVAISAAFNWFRYGQITNYTYGHAIEHVHGFAHRLALGVALWLAPNGGVGWFWPLGTIVVVGVAVIAGLTLRRNRAVVSDLRATHERRRRGIPAIGLAVVLLLMTATLASWYAPFGWEAWGPRLVMPILPAVLVVTLVIYNVECSRLLRPILATPCRVVLAGVVITIIALPQVISCTPGRLLGSCLHRTARARQPSAWRTRATTTIASTTGPGTGTSSWCLRSGP